jgi:hypothetical protein
VHHGGGTNLRNKDAGDRPPGLNSARTHSVSLAYSMFRCARSRLEDRKDVPGWES